MNTSLSSHFNGWQLVYAAFAIYANYKVFKWFFGAVKSVATSDFLRTLVFKLTPNSVIQKRREKRIDLARLQKNEEQWFKEKQHQEALEIHRTYNYTSWWNIGFIEEDRATLFNGYEDIPWRWGSHKIDRSKNYFPDDSKRLAFMIFQEMAIYRWQFKEHGKWTPEMEIFWQKILPKQSFTPITDWQHNWFANVRGNATIHFIPELFAFGGLNLMTSIGTKKYDARHFGIGYQLGLGGIVGSFLVKAFYERNGKISLFSDGNSFKGYGVSVGYLFSL
jgi:hypothetical protein